VKEKQKKKHFGFENPIKESDAYTPSEDDKIVQDADMSIEPKIETDLPEVDGHKQAYDPKTTEYIEKDTYPSFGQEQADKPRKKVGKDPKNLPWDQKE
jgi:hypothetical protein